MSVKVVLGAGFGDEGKGLVTDYLCSQNPKNTMVLRFSGGHQCGHKVIRDGVEHIFSNFGAGTLLGCPTYWSEHCTFEPVGFMKEWKLLGTKGISPVIYLSLDCPVVTPYDIYACQEGIERQHGTTGTGFYRTKKRHFTDNLRFTLAHFLFSPVADKLTQIRQYYQVPGMNMDAFIQARTMLMYLITSGSTIRIFDPPKFEHVICEGSQGLLLDPEIGYMPHCTPSDLTPRNVMKLGYEIDEVYLVSRVYQTRHGNGPMTNKDLLEPDLIHTAQETNVTNEYQGAFRKSLLDIHQLLRAKVMGIDLVVPNARTNLVLTCTDQVSEYSLAADGIVQQFKNLTEFAEYVGGVLNIENIYVNSSPFPGAIKKV